METGIKVTVKCPTYKNGRKFSGIITGEKPLAPIHIAQNGKTYFVNASCCSDGNMSKISSHGWICTYDLINKKVIEIFKN